MRILVISDIHANLSAFETVLDSAGSCDAVWCLGDIVGYGPDPNECITLLRGLPNLTCLIGNHDAAALGTIDLNTFNREARTSSHWTQQVLTAESRAYLQGLPERIVHENVTLAHGSPRSPVWEYLLDPIAAYENLSFFKTDLCFVGHTHIPVAFRYLPDTDEMQSVLLRDGDSPEMDERMIINPGSVGQPRDHDSRAAYAIYNPETRLWRSYRVRYDIRAVQDRMRQAGLPSRLIQRLMEGW